LAETTKVGITSALVMILTLVQHKAIRFVQFISLGFYRLLRMYLNFCDAINPYMLDLNPISKLMKLEFNYGLEVNAV
jgi:hypothetical protein